MKSLRVLKITMILLMMINTGCKNKQENKITSAKSISDLEVLVGTYTNDTSKGIYKLKMNSETGEIKSKALLVEVDNPSFLTVSKDGKQVFAVQENEAGKVSSYQFNADKSKLIEISTEETNGKHPCYVSLNEAENLLAVGNYSSGNLSVYQLGNKDSISNSVQIKQHIGQGTLLPRQESPHAHCVKFYKDNFLYAVDLGIDQVICYPIQQNKLGDKTVALKADAADGPRHLTFHPTKNVSYVTTEFTNSIIVSKIDNETGVFNRIQKISMLPESHSKESFAADIHLSNDGKFLYASNRGHNSIATFSVDDEGKLTLIDHVSTEGNWPRNFVLSPDNKFLLVANQFGNNVVVFKRDEKSGKLTYTGYQEEMSIPVFVKFL